MQSPRLATTRSADVVALQRDPRISKSYVVLHKVAVGGMGAVYAARARASGRKVALKVLHRELLTDAKCRHMMLREAHALAVCAHPGVVELLEHGETSCGLPFLALEWLDGTSLHADLDEDGPAPLRRIATRFAQLMDILGHVHDRGVVHADLKPDNVLLVPSLERGERIKLVDFGVSSLGLERWAPPGEVFGTPGYLSPEVARGAQPTVASDIYAAGALLFELVTGEHAFPGRTLAEVAQMQAGAPPRPSVLRLRVDKELDKVIAKALATRPEERFSSAHAFKDAAVAALHPVDPQRAGTRGTTALVGTRSTPTASLRKA